MKEFNITGVCVPRKHYMADISGKIEQILNMVDRGYYFTINRPRQYGKTTTINLLEQVLEKKADYLVLSISFEGIDAPTHKHREGFISVFLNQIKRWLLFEQHTDLAAFIDSHQTTITDFDTLSAFLTNFILKAARRVVIMIDEVDQSSNNQLFLDFLGMLRNKYLRQNRDKDYSFHSVILAGVHDVKTLKTKIREDGDAKFNSPWNIAMDFKVDLSLLPREIEPMLKEYAADQKVAIDIPWFSQRLFYFTSGYPFLVSKLCKTISEEILPQKEQSKNTIDAKKTWEPQDLDFAVQRILKEDNTNFASLIKNLENNKDLYDFVFRIIINGSEVSFNLDNPIIHLGHLYGIFKEENSKTRVHNRVYEQRIYNYMSSKMETSDIMEGDDVSTGYREAAGGLNMEKVLLRFQKLMKEQYSHKDKTFIEQNGRLLFLAFLKPIINGNGFDFKEVQISDEKRLDIVVTYGTNRYIIELKVWRGEQYFQKGIAQLCDYLDRQDANHGYLIVYDPRKESGQVGKYETINEAGKRISAVWV